MLSRSLLLAILATSCRSQYQINTDLRADITFNDENDRYDVGNIIQAQKQQFKNLPSQMENAEEEDGFRRSSGFLSEVLKRERRRHQRGSDTRRMDNTDFAYHEPVSRVADDVDVINEEYGTNLATFNTYLNQNTRRTGNIKYKPSKIVKLHSSNRRKGIYFFDEFTPKTEEKQKKIKNKLEEKYEKIQNKRIEKINKKKQKNEDRQKKLMKILTRLKQKHELLEKELIEKKKNNKKSAGLENILKKFVDFLNPGRFLRQGRKKMEASPEDRTLVRYAVPLKMKFPGYLEMPEGLKY